MGCYDSVCSVSHVPVHHGDDVVVLYCASDFGGEYPNHKYAPMTLPIFGKYNDYGDVEDIDETGVGYTTIQRLLESKFKDVIRNSSDLYEKFKDNMGAQMLPDSWTDGRTSKYKKDERPSYANQGDPDAYTLAQNNGTVIQQMFVHRKVWEHFLVLFKTDNIGWSTETTGQDIFDDIPAFVDAMYKRQKLESLYIEARKHQPEEQCIIEEKLEKEYNVNSLWFVIDRSLTLPHLDGSGFSPEHYLNTMFASYRSDYETMLPAACRHVRYDVISELLKQGNEHRDYLIALVTSMLELAAFSVQLYRHNMEFAPYYGFAADQYQEERSANKMNNLFSVFTQLQNEKMAESQYGDE